MTIPNQIGAYEARTRLGELLKRVAAGERFTITNRGEPIAELVPPAKGGKATAQAAVDAMRSVKPIKGVSTPLLLEMIAEGRRQ